MEIIGPRGPFEYLGILWRKKLVILLVAASVSIATLQVIRRIPNVYESHALIVISYLVEWKGSSDARIH
ncbi:MAG TPA: hypothetical protein VKS99_00355 [Blastocatellia bacterium]|nr:hypothetical protein [Blastocatellia bacterium]